MMRQEILTIYEIDVFQEARDHFIHICGFSDKGQKKLNMLNDGLECRIKGLAGLKIRAIIGTADSSVYHNQKIMVEHKEFRCKAFERIQDRFVKKIYFYILTVGECNCALEDEIVNRLYADIWGTAYTEAARDYVKNRILNDLIREFPGQLGNGLFLSETFGPGFYGMDVLQSIDLFTLLEGRRIGMEVRESGILVPLKSCSGIFLAVTDPKALPHPDCRDCLGNAVSCSFCRLRENKN